MPGKEKSSPAACPENAAAQGFHQPVTRNKHLNQRAQQHAQYGSFPDGKEIDHRIIPRRLKRAGISLSENGFTDAVRFGGGEGFSVIRLPFHIPEANDNHEKEECGFPPLNRCCRLR
jgi:hypothetical protein